MAQNSVTDEERAEIVALLRTGKTPYAVAKKSGRSRPTVCKIARRAGIDVNVNATKRATEAKAAWDQVRRMELVGKGMAHAEAMLPTIAETRDLQAWMMAVGIGIDKLRLENNEPTSIGESRRGGLDLESEFRKLDAEIHVSESSGA